MRVRKTVNLLNHPVYEHLPLRTKKKLLSAVSEDKLTWDCFYELHRADVLAATLEHALSIEIEPQPPLRLIMWGWEIDGNAFDNLMSRLDGRPTVLAQSKAGVEWAPLQSILAEIENYGDGKLEGQKTEPDVIVVTKTLLILFECKRKHGLGRCSRFEHQQCPEIHIEGRKRDYCQYWTRGLPSLVNFPRPTPATESEPPCNRFYQLLRNYMIGSRLAAKLDRKFYPVVVKNPNSPHFDETDAEIKSFNATTRRMPKYKVTSWATARDKARQSGIEVLWSYTSEL
jgi:hypothetical protein